MSFTNFLENELLDHVFAPAAYTAPATVYMKLHLGDPGEDALNSAAANTTRQVASLGLASGGTISNDAQIQWTSVPNAETYSHVSIWDASTGGNPLAYGALTTARTVAVGDTFTIPTGDLDISLG